METLLAPNCAREGAAPSSFQLIVQLDEAAHVVVEVGAVTKTVAKAEAARDRAMTAAENIFLV